MTEGNTGGSVMSGSGSNRPASSISLDQFTETVVGAVLRALDARDQENASLKHRKRPPVFYGLWFASLDSVEPGQQTGEITQR
ncbi:MAG TPA: hypothetical protein VFI42_06675 [Thermomicrobiaceae bacterium]|nr:hypothetical protein [Thermomicrobiaceae bacterium]